MVCTTCVTRCFYFFESSLERWFWGRQKKLVLCCLERQATVRKKFLETKSHPTNGTGSAQDISQSYQQESSPLIGRFFCRPPLLLISSSISCSVPSFKSRLFQILLWWIQNRRCRQRIFPLGGGQSSDLDPVSLDMWWLWSYSGLFDTSLSLFWTSDALLVAKITGYLEWRQWFWNSAVWGTLGPICIQHQQAFSSECPFFWRMIRWNWRWHICHCILLSALSELFWVVYILFIRPRETYAEL